MEALRRFLLSMRGTHLFGITLAGLRAGRLVALAGAKQAKAQDRRSPAQAHRRLDQLGIDEWQIRHAVGNHLDLPGIDAVDVRKSIRGRLREDDDPG